MSVRLRIIGTVTGEPSPFDGQFIKAYDPSYWPAGEEYDGGLLETTPNPDDALQFDDVGAALECWRKPFGTRTDGKPNRPLTAFTCEVAR